MQFFFLVKQTKGVLNSNRDWTKTVESPQRALNSVFDVRLTARTKLHQDVIRSFFDSHHFGNSVTYFQNLGQR